MIMKNFLSHLGFLFCFALTLRAFEIEDYEYGLMQNATLVFGAPTFLNRELIQQLASLDYSVITWSKTNPTGTYPHPIVTTNDKLENFVNCLFYDPNNNATLITDYYFKKMLKSTQAVKLVFIASMDFLKSENGSFAQFLEWIAQILPNAEKFEPSMILLIIEQDVEVSPTLDTTLDLLSRATEKLGDYIRPDLLVMVQGISKKFSSPKVGVSWKPLAVLKTLNSIPFTNMLPTDLGLFSNKTTTTTAEIISALNEAQILTFKNAVAQVDSMIGFFNEEDFSDRLQSLRKLKRALEETRQEMMNATTWNQAAEILDKNMETVKIILDPAFKRNVSIGQDILYHIQTTTGRSGEDLKKSISQIVFHPLIMKTLDYITKYSEFSSDFHDKVKVKEGARVRGNQLGNSSDILSRRNMTLQSAMNSPKKSDGDSTPADKTLLPQERIHGTGLFTHTVYKIHPVEYPNCFLAAVPLDSALECIDRKYTEKPAMVCSANDREKFYEQQRGSWFLFFCKSVFCLANLKTGKEGFLSVHNENAQCHNGSIMADIGNDIGNIYQFVGNVRGTRDPSVVRFENPTRGYRLKEFKGNSRAWFELGQLPGAEVKLTPDFKLEAKLSKFEFTKPDPFSSTKKDFADSFEIANHGPTTVTRKVILSEDVTENFSFGFSEDLSFCAKVTAEAKVSAGVSGIAEAEAKTGFEISTELKKGKHEDYSKTTTKRFTMEYELSVPPCTTAHISAWYEKVGDLKLPFTMKTEISGNGTRITRYNDIVATEAASGGDILQFLHQRGFKGTITKINDFSVEMTMEGELTASVGLLGQIGVTSSKLSDCFSE